MKNTFLNNCFCLSFFMFALIESASAMKYYVAANGNDTNPGTFANPWATIQKAADVASAGDSVIVFGGVYRERVALTRSGVTGRYIVFTALDQQQVTIDGAGIIVPEYSGLFDLSGQSYISITGLRIVNSNEAGILADGSRNVIIDLCSTFNTATSGIGIWNCSDVIVRNCRVELACTNGMQECISIGSTARFEVSNNTIVHCKKEGICPKDGSSYGKVFGNVVDSTDHVGIYVDAWNKHTFYIDVYNNIVRNIARKDGLMVASEQGGLLENVRLYNNISYNNAYNGIGVSACCPDVPDHPIKNIAIVNNTVAYNGRSGWGGGIGIDRNPLIENLVIRNNLCSQNPSFQIAIDSIVPVSARIVDHNLIDGFMNGEGEVRGASFIEADPQFVNAAARDFHLRNTSPAIDAGESSVAPLFDFDNKVRPFGKAIDIGCYEYLSPNKVDETKPNASDEVLSFEIYPNPLTHAAAIRYKLFAVRCVKLEVFDALGRHVATLVDGTQDAGEHVAAFDIRGTSRALSSGMYPCILQAGSMRSIRMMAIIR